MRKSVSVIASTAIIAAVVAGCGGSGSSNNAASGGSGGGTSTVPVSSRPTAPEPTVASLTKGCSKLPVKTSKIGYLVPLTGATSGDAHDVIDGGNLALSQLNAAGGVCGKAARYKFTTVTADTQNQLASAVASGTKLLLTTSGMNLVMTGYASSTNFEMQQFAQAKMPYLLSANPVQTVQIIGKDPSAYPTVWNRVSNYDEYNTELPKLLNQWGQQGKLNLGNKSVYIISATDPFDTPIYAGLKKNFPADGWKVVGTQTVPLGTVTDWHTTLAKIASAKPTLVALLDYTPSVEVAFQKQFLQAGIKSLVFMEYGPSLPQFLQAAKSSANGVIYDQIGAANPAQADTRRISAQFTAKYGRRGGYFAVVAYNEAMIYAYCVRKVGDPTDHLGIGDCFRNMKIHSPAGILAFDPKTHLALNGPKYESIQFLQFQNGKAQLIYPQGGVSKQVQTPPWIKK